MLKFCSSPFDTVNISESGDVSLCLCKSWHTKGIMGNLNSNPLKELFVGQWASEFRHSVIDQTFRHCNPVQCGKFHNLDQVSQIDQTLLTPSLPKNLMLHIDKNCNLKCASCRNENTYSPDANPATQFILESLARDYQDFDSRVLVYCDGAGDVFASTAYQNFLRSSQVPTSWQFCFTTNGNLITKNIDIFDRLADQIDIVIVSLDAATPETYKAIRGGVFEIVVQGIESLVKRGIKVSSQFVVQSQNYHEIPQYVSLCKQLGIRHIGLQKLDRWLHQNPAWWKINRIENNSTVDYDFLLTELQRLQADPQVGLCGGLIQLLNIKKPLNCS